MRESTHGNRAKMNCMQLKWDKQVEKQMVFYSTKAKKKEFPNMVNNLAFMKRESRDRFLLRYIFKCRAIHSLAFFQWRCLTLEDED